MITTAHSPSSSASATCTYAREAVHPAIPGSAFSTQSRLGFRILNSHLEGYLREVKRRTVRVGNVKWRPALGSTAQKTLAVPQVRDDVLEWDIQPEPARRKFGDQKTS